MPSHGDTRTRDDTDPSDTESLIRKYALQNAVFYKGKADPRAVMGKIMAGNHELRKRAKEVIPLTNRIVEEVNALTPGAQRSALAAIDESMLERERKDVILDLPDLDNVADSGVVMRFAPGPSGPLHIGHSRAVILNDEYVKRYGGKFILRLEDTNPGKIDPKAYESIRKDLDWLGVGCRDEDVFIQSDRFDIYYHHMEKLLHGGAAYICTCDVEEWRELKNDRRPCPHRELPPGTQLTEWRKMLDGTYGDGEASAVVKTDLSHPNPAVRDFVGMRINSTTPHPRTGKEYRVYPLYNFSVAVDDHLMGITHVLRGKDHLNNTHRQRYIYDFFGWKAPGFIHYGWVSIEDTLLKTSLIKDGIANGEYDGWADPRLGTFRAMERRGIRPEAIRRYWKEAGIKAVDIRFSWENLYSFNKDLIDPGANRYFFVPSPVKLSIDSGENKKLVSSAPYHPDHPGRGARRYELTAGVDGMINVHVPGDELFDIMKDGRPRTVRLKDLGNLEVRTVGSGACCEYLSAKYIGNDLSVIKKGARIIQWCPADSIPCVLHMPDGSIVEGRAEPLLTDEKEEMVQFERMGFVRLERNSKDGVKAFFAHK